MIYCNTSTYPYPTYDQLSIGSLPHEYCSHREKRAKNPVIEHIQISSEHEDHKVDLMCFGGDNE